MESADCMTVVVIHLCTAALGIQTKNWPPFFPLIRNNIAEDCPEHTQSIMYFGYYTWLGTPMNHPFPPLLYFPCWWTRIKSLSVQLESLSVVKLVVFFSTNSGLTLSLNGVYQPSDSCAAMILVIRRCPHLPDVQHPSHHCCVDCWRLLRCAW